MPRRVGRIEDLPYRTHNAPQPSPTRRTARGGEDPGQYYWPPVPNKQAPHRSIWPPPIESHDEWKDRILYGRRRPWVMPDETPPNNPVDWSSLFRGFGHVASALSGAVRNPAPAEWWKGFSSTVGEPIYQAAFGKTVSDLMRDVRTYQPEAPSYHRDVFSAYPGRQNVDKRAHAVGSYLMAQRTHPYLAATAGLGHEVLEFPYSVYQKGLYGAWDDAYRDVLANFLGLSLYSRGY